MAATAFVLTLGRLHPSDALRDRIVVTALALVLAANAPAVLFVVKRGQESHSSRGIAREVLVVAVRLVVTIGALWFASTVSHERGL